MLRIGLSRWTLVGFLIFAVAGVRGSALAEPVDRFVGELDLLDLDPQGVRFTLAQPFGYIDPSGTRWQAEKGLVTDGASIPWPLWSIVGAPFTGPYRRAAVIHDFYCDRKYRAWEKVHRVFYDAMITGGVDPLKAKLMYYAVWRFGPRWSVSQIVPCVADATHVCGSAKPTSLELTVEKPIVEEKDVPAAEAELKGVEDKLAGTNVSLDEIERLADAKPPIQRETTRTRKAVVSTTPIGRYEDFKLSDTNMILPENQSAPTLFPETRQ